ncbi:MAG TPA: hypothetical protein VGH90_01045, partial [Chthoniobacteraceae bacterium]
MGNEKQTAAINAWLEKFTGIGVADGTVKEDPKVAADAFKKDQAEKQKLLASSRQAMNVVKQNFRAAMSEDVEVREGSMKDQLFGRQMLVDDGTQVDEVDFKEIDFGATKLSDRAQQAIKKGQATITNQSEILKGARTVRNGESVPLFTKDEIQNEFWTPLVRERILPETFVADHLSETKTMLARSLAEYQKGIEAKKKAGKLTPTSGKRTLLDVGSDVAGLAGSAAIMFVPGSADAKLASAVLKTTEQVCKTAGTIYDKAVAKEYGDAAVGALDGAISVTGIILGAAGVPTGLTKAIQAGLKGGSSLIKAGRKFAQCDEAGAKGGAELIGAVISSALASAAALDENKTRGAALAVAADAAPVLFTKAVLAANIVKKLEDNDTDGLKKLLLAGAVTAIKEAGALYGSSTGLRDEISGKAQAERDKDKREKEEHPEEYQEKQKEKAFEKEAKVLEGKEQDQLAKEIPEEIPELMEAWEAAKGDPDAEVQMALIMAQGKLSKGVEAVVDAIATGLSQSLRHSGLSETMANQVGSLYHAATSPAAALTALRKLEPDVAGAVAELSKGVETAMKKAAPDKPALAEAGKALGAAVNALAGGIRLNKYYDEKEYVEGVEFFCDSLLQKVSSALAPPTGLEAGEDEGEEARKQKDEIVLQLGKLGSAASTEGQSIEAGLKAEAEAETLAEVEEALAEQQEELAQMRNEAADIEKLIGKMDRDRLLLELATQIVSGGAAFLASFVPVLGSVAAGVKMAVSFKAAGERASQLYKWSQNKSDFAAAQSALTAPAQNFVKNQRDQFAQYAVATFFQAAQLIGNATKVAGVTAAISQGIEATGKVGEALNEIFHKYKKKWDLESAWNQTKKAIQDPANRRAGLLAARDNPTWAKYCIAWGAYEKKDSLAMNAVRACKLTEAVLESESANLGKVVEYLESFYADDAQLYRDIDAVDWLPTDLPLTLKSWMEVKSLGAENIGLKTSGTGEIDGCFAQIRSNVAKLTEEQIPERLKVLDSLAAALDAYKPEAKDEDGVKAMKNVA